MGTHGIAFCRNSLWIVFARGQGGSKTLTPGAPRKTPPRWTSALGTRYTPNRHFRHIPSRLCPGRRDRVARRSTAPRSPRNMHILQHSDRLGLRKRQLLARRRMRKRQPFSAVRDSHYSVFPNSCEVLVQGFLDAAFCRSTCTWMAFSPPGTGHCAAIASGELHGEGVGLIRKPFAFKQACTLRYELPCSSERAW